MENKNILNHSELAFRIMQLRSEKLSQEIEIKHSVKELVYTLNPINMVKDSFRSLTQDKETKFDIAKTGLNLGANFILDKVLGRNKSIKGFLTSIAIEKISGLLINKNAPKIIAGIGKLISSRASNKNNQID